MAQQTAPNAEQLFRDAVAAQKRGDDGTAIRHYREVIKLRPDVLEARANLGAALAHAGRFDEAIAEYRLALEKAPTNSALRLNLGLAFYKKNDWKSAASEFEQLHKAEPGNVRVTTLLGDCYGHLHRDADALALLGPVAAAQPDNLDVAWAYGHALIQAEQLKEGCAQIEKVAQHGNSADAYLLAGETALRLNEFERARTDGDAALRLNPQLPGVQTLRGRTLVYLGDDAGALAALEAALAANPKDFEAHLTLGAMLNTQRDLPKAREHLEEAVRLDAGSVLARYELARVERSQNELEKAAGVYFKLKRPQDGQREREIVDRLTAAEARQKTVGR